MTTDVVSRRRSRRRTAVLILPFTLLATALAAAAGVVVAYLLWPTWPTAIVTLDAPALPITVAGVLFNVPPMAIRAAVQRHPGAHERVDLVFLWPSLDPPQPAGKGAERPASEPAAAAGDEAAGMPSYAKDRVFVTIAGLGAVLPPVERLRSIYPRYLEEQATAGPDGLGVQAFRADTPYQGEDLVYRAEKPEGFFARCTRKIRSVPGNCMHERVLDGAEITLRFPREWLDDWRGVADGFDRLIALLHPNNG